MNKMKQVKNKETSSKNDCVGELGEIKQNLVFEKK